MYATKYDAKNKLWSGNEYSPLFNPKVSLGQILHRFMKVHGSTFAQICDDTGERMDYNEMWLKTVRVAQNLQKLGYSKSDIFAYSIIDRLVSPVIYAAFCMGCPVNTVSPVFAKADAVQVLKITKPKLLFCNVERYSFMAECLQEAGNDAKIFTFGGTAGDSFDVEDLFIETGIEHHFLTVPVDGANEIAALLCSSGSTGPSKVVALSHVSLVEDCINIGLLNAGDIHYCPGSFYWISGLYMMILGIIHGATAVITRKQPTADSQIRLIERYKISFLMNSPHHLLMMLKSEAIKTADLSSIKCYFVGGNRIAVGAPAAINRYLPNGKICIGYGQTESSLLISGTFTEVVEEDHVGKLVNGSIVKIVDENGARCGVGVEGQICVKCNHPFLGYYGNENATADAIDEEGFILTGDVGRFDENGDLHIIDRLNAVFKSGEIFISPSEIESYIIKSPDIESVCVVGVPDGVNGCLPAAAIVRNKNSTITDYDVYEMVANNFDVCKHLRGGVYFLETFPSTLGGKYMRKEIRNIVIRLSKC